MDCGTEDHEKKKHPSDPECDGDKMEPEAQAEKVNREGHCGPLSNPLLTILMGLLQSYCDYMKAVIFGTESDTYRSQDISGCRVFNYFQS